jgi:hypothetical protein
MKKIYGANTLQNKSQINKLPFANSNTNSLHKSENTKVGSSQIYKTPASKLKENIVVSTTTSATTSQISEENANDSDYYVKCWNCDGMVLISEVDKHSKICTEQSQIAIQRSFLPLNDQLNIQIENIKKIVKIKASFNNGSQVWDEFINIMNILQTLDDFTNVTIMTLRKQINAIKMLITSFKGTYSGLLFLNKIDVIAKQKYEHVVTNYKNMYSQQVLKENNGQMKKIIMEGRLSNFSSTSNLKVAQNNSLELEPTTMFNDDVNKSQDFGTNREVKAVDSLKRQFYYKCISIKKKLSKACLGFWVESAPLYNYARNNKIPVTDWDKFIEQELTTNVLKWIDPLQLEKLEMINQKRKSTRRTKLNIINEDS